VPKVRDTAIQRQLIHLEVARVEDISALCADENSQGIRDGVVYGHELTLERAELLNLPLSDSQGVRLDPVFLELGFHQGKSQLGSDQGDVSFEAEEVGYRADVVLVTMGQHDAYDVLQPVLDVGEIRQDQVDAGLGLFREEHAAVNYQQLAVDFEDRHVAANLSQSTERDNPQRAFGQFRRSNQSGKGGLGHVLLLSGGAVLDVEVHSGFRQIPADDVDLGRVRLHEGQTDNRVGQDSLPLENLLGGYCALDPRHGCTYDGFQFKIDGPCRGEVAGVDGVDQLAEAAGGHVGGDAHQADGSQGHPLERQSVITGVEHEVRLGHHARCGGKVRFGVLDGNNVLVLRQRNHGLGSDRNGGPARNVVQHDGKVRGRRNRLKVCTNARLAGLVVIGGDDQETVDAEFRRALRKVHGVCGVVGAGPGDDGRLAANGLFDCPEHTEVFVVRKG
jgi:hypothetical protein